MEIYVTRHSKTLWNEEKRLQGWKDSPLTAEGIEDAKKLKERIKDIHFDACYTSPILRAKTTADVLFDHNISDDRLKEMNFGKYEGEKLSILNQNKAYMKLWNEPELNYGLEGGESYQEVISRLEDFLHEVYRKYPEGRIFVTLHGFIFIILHSLALGIPVERINEINRTVVRGCSLTIYEYDGNNFNIKMMGDESHLPAKEKIKFIE